MDPVLQLVRVRLEPSVKVGRCYRNAVLEYKFTDRLVVLLDRHIAEVLAGREIRV